MEEKNIMARIIESISVMNPTCCDPKDVFENPNVLSQEEPRVLIRFLSDDDFARNCGRVFAFIAAKLMIDKTELDHEEALSYCEGDDTDKADIEALLNLPGFTTFLLDRNVANLLALFSILNGIGYAEEAIGSRLVKFYTKNDYRLFDHLNLICSSFRMDCLVNELIVDIDPDSDTSTPLVRFLIQVLLKYRALSDHGLLVLIQKCLKRLGNREIIYLTKVEHNSPRVERCLAKLFRDSLESGNPSFYYALSLVRLASDPNWLETADKMAGSHDTENVLLGLALLGLTAWCRCNHAGVLDSMDLRLSEPTLENIRKYLSSPNNGYKIVSDAVLDLSTYNLLDVNLLMVPKIVDTALDLAKSPDKHIRSAAEQILALIPIHCTYVSEDVLRSYLPVFDEYMHKDVYDPHGAIIFKILTKLRNSETEVFLMDLLKQLYAKGCPHMEALNDSDIALIEMAREELFAFPIRQGHYYETSWPVFSTLSNTLSSADMNNLMVMTRRMHREGIRFVANGVDAAKIVNFLRSGVNPESISILLENTVFQFHEYEVGSYLLTLLFYLMVHFRKSVQAAAFFERFHDVLLRPYKFCLNHAPFRGLRAQAKENHDYMTETITRVEAIFHYMLQQGNRSVAEYFASEKTAPTHLPKEVRQRIQTLLEDHTSLVEELQLQGLPPFVDTDRVTVPTWDEPAEPLEFWMLFPDDLMATTHVLEKRTEWAPVIINYAYKSDRILAEHLIEKRSYFHRFFTPEVKLQPKIMDIYRRTYEQELEELKHYGGTI